MTPVIPVTVTSYDWDDLCGVIALTGDAQHRHIPGTPDEWEHNYVPISEAAAKTHFGGKVPKGWRAPAGRAGAKAAGTAPQASPAAAPVKVTRRDLTAIRKQTGLDMGHPDAYLLGAAKPDYTAALGHLAAGRHDEALSAMDRMVARAQGMKGAEGKRTARAAESMRDKVRGALSKPSKAAAPKPGAVPAPEAAPAVGPEWKRTMDEMAAKERAAGISNAHAMDRNHALHSAQAMHMREATGGITFPHPSDLGGHPGDNGAWQASDLFARGDLPGAANALDRQAAGETSKARAARNTKLAAQLRAVTLKPTLPSLAKVPGTQQPDKSFTALDHEGNEYRVRLRPVSLGKSEVTVTRGGRSVTAPAGDNPERTARVLAARMAPATDAEIRDAESAVVRGQMLTARQSEVLRQSNDRLTAQASRQFDAARGKTVQAANSALAAVELSARTRKDGPMAAAALKPKTKTGPVKAPPGRQEGRTPGTATPGPGGQRAAAQPARSDANRHPSGRVSRQRQTPLTPMRREAAKKMRALAASVQDSHPDMTVHEHLRDAARTLEAGNEEGAQRHLRAAMFALTPQSLMRNGLHTDDSHVAARDAMHSVHRHLLLVKDITDVAARNQEAVRRDSGDGAAVPPPRPDPNAGYGPGANAQKPTARQPPGDQAMNAPAKADGGGSDPAVADPVGTQPRGSKQFTTWDEVLAVTELAIPRQATAYTWDNLASVIDMAAGDDCYRCKTPNAPDARYCKRCGFGMEPREPYDRFTAEDVTCPFCGRGDEADAVFCDQCGKRLPAAPVTAFAGGGKAIGLSARTAALEVTPAPIGKPGGPGLYGVAGLGHSDYFQQVRNGLMKRGVPEGRAHAMTWGILRRWAAGSGKVHPEVRDAAGKALAEEAAKGAQAKAHAHAVSWDQVSRDIELATVIELFNPAQPRLPVGPGGGQFAGGGAQPAGGQQPAGKAPAKAQPKPKPTAAQLHALHVAHVAHVNGVSTAKAGFMVAAADDRAKASALIRQRDALAKALASAGGKVSSGQAGAKTAKTATTKTTAPVAAKSTTAAPAKAPAAAKTSTAPAKTPAARPSAPAPKATSAAGIKAQITALNTQISALLAQAKQADAQAAKAK